MEHQEKNLITMYAKDNQQEKKQKIEQSIIADSWEDMNEMQQNEWFNHQYQTIQDQREST